MQQGEYRWVAVLVGSVIFFSIGLLLFWWFGKTHKKLYPPLPEHILESRFYTNNPNLSKMLDGWSFNGFGTRYLTYSNKHNDGSFYATKWITMAYFPIIPLYQQCIKIISENERIVPFVFSSSRMEIELLERIKLDKSLNNITYVFHYLFILPSLVLPVILMLVFIHELGILFPGTRFWWLILLYLAWGIFLFFLMNIWNKRLFLKRKK